MRVQEEDTMMRLEENKTRPFVRSPQTADLPRAEDLHDFRRVRVPDLLGGHAALLAAAHGGQLPRLQLLPQLHARRRRAARHCLLPPQGEGQG